MVIKLWDKGIEKRWEIEQTVVEGEKTKFEFEENVKNVEKCEVCGSEDINNEK